MDAQRLISGIIFGLSIGGIFFLMAIGLSLCFGLMRIISLDQLLYYSIGGYFTYSLSLATGSVWLGVLRVRGGGHHRLCGGALDFPAHLRTRTHLTHLSPGPRYRDHPTRLRTRAILTQGRFVLPDSREKLTGKGLPPYTENRAHTHRTSLPCILTQPGQSHKNLFTASELRAGVVNWWMMAFTLDSYGGREMNGACGVLLHFATLEDPRVGADYPLEEVLLIALADSMWG